MTFDRLNTEEMSLRIVFEKSKVCLGLTEVNKSVITWRGQAICTCRLNEEINKEAIRGSHPDLS